ncbi:NmrA family transcriptional regulator [Coccidioides immitis RS]|uniref:NmrA family transcriptional regulator n=3 Tax=Coccidioides immitis TaxID=5501 RepID=A0A0E1RVM0_COCIM|nr:NmrA family transcriptional regulator [Coccidioides immitis RS]EAS30127.1 NmrA family transcriptional regulator [Coccidioides immitis RS]KMP07076.1 hypothetical protein CIRG_06757 [Coccidioides immitis RMSCC 2394]KMU78955.1 NmrA family protein [Coccidioides immitis RMSCC 3703]TPX22109.1 hypothetical protein DIZ76_013974 [Coccidioides immitis]
MSKLIVVFGATGNQGGSVVDAILQDPVLSKEFRIRGITRDVTKPAAKALESKGVEVKTANMDSPASVGDAVAGAHTVFLVTSYWESLDAETEYNQGKNVATAAKEANVSHLIFSSLYHIMDASAGALLHVPHFDTKANIEVYIRELQIPATFVLPGYFMSNFLSTLLKGEDGMYTLMLPITDKAQFPLFDVADTGKYVLTAIKHRDSLLGKQILEAVDYYSPDRIVEEFEQVTGHKAKFLTIDADDYMKFLPPAVAKEMLQTHQLLENPGYYAGATLEESLKLVEQKPTTWKEYVAKRSEWK